MSTNEKVMFRLIWMPCCHSMFCWVNPRLPNYCPECGKRVYADLKWNKPESILVTDDNAWLKLNKEIPSNAPLLQETKSKKS